MKRIKPAAATEIRNHIESAIRASFLSFLSCKYAGVNRLQFTRMTQREDLYFIDQFLHEEGSKFVNPSRYKAKQPDFYLGSNEILKTIYRYRSKLSYGTGYPQEAFEFMPNGSHWALRFSPGYIDATRRYALRRGKLSLARFSIWFYRNTQFRSNEGIDGIKSNFLRDFGFRKRELKELFDDDQIAGFKEMFEEVPAQTDSRSVAVIGDLSKSVAEDLPPNRVSVSRKVRDSKHAETIKRLYDFRCQICGQTLDLPNKERYAEAHHVRPYGDPHNGPDKESNIMCVCPNHHALLDCAAIKLDISRLKLKRHEIDSKYIDYHNSLYTEKFETQ